MLLRDVKAHDEREKVQHAQSVQMDGQKRIRRHQHHGQKQSKLRQRKHRNEQPNADDVGVEIPGDFGNMYTREIESFSDSILNNKPLVVPASDAVHVQRIMEKAYASGEELKILKI